MNDVTDATAVREISQLTTTANGIDFTREAIVVPEGMTVVDLERFHDFRRRYRGKFKTETLAAFVAYVAPFADGQSCFVDAEAGAATMVLDAGTEDKPGHCEHAAMLTLRKTAAYAALTLNAGKALTQQSMAEFLEDWHHVLTPYGADGTEIAMSRAISAIRKIDIKATINRGSEVQNMSASRSSLERIEASSVDTLPAGFSAKIAPYKELEVRKIDLQLSVRTSDEPKMIYRVVGYEALAEDIAEEFAALLGKQLPGQVTPIIGTFVA